MGGPCRILDEANGNQRGPPCTDNFQVRPFTYDSAIYQSCEQAFQAAKFVADTPSGKRWQERIRAIVKQDGESDSSHAIRCWQAGQRGPLRLDWDAVKVLVMYEVNLAKYKEHPDLRESLEATGRYLLVGGPSTGWQLGAREHNWGRWNGLVQMRIREELRTPIDRTPGLLENLLQQFDEYAVEAALVT